MMGSFIKKHLYFDDPDIISVTEFIKNRLYFVSYKNKVPEDTKRIHFFSANDDYPDENSEPISRLSLGLISHFIKTLNTKLNRKRYAEKVLANYTTGSERKRSNAAVLMGVYAITYLQMSPEEATEKLSSHTTISPLDSLKAVHKAINLGLVNFQTFDCEEFNSLDDVKLNWVVPDKFLMFTGPLETSHGRYLSPRRYITFFHSVGVRIIIRFCHIKYDANPFVDADIPHYDLNIQGSVPSDKVLEVFLQLTEECEGVVLVHCREFLGRAGTLVAASLIKHHGLSSGEATAWVRLCTSECILEAQKTWLRTHEEALHAAGERRNKAGPPRGICDREGKQSDRASSVAQFENEVRVVELEKSETDVKSVKNMA